MAGWSVPGVVHLQEVREDLIGRRVLARHRITRKSVGITYLSSELLADTEFRTRFSREFPRLARVRNSGVTRVHQYVESLHGVALVGDHVSGTPLRAALLAHGALGVEAALVVLKDTLRALAACHQAGLSHGDIKPENVILTTAGRIRLVDFGLWTSDGRRLLNRSTPFYLAPEQWSGDPAGQAGDVYAATVTFFECLAGAPPFYAKAAPELLAKHRHDTPPVDVIPELVRELARSGLVKDVRSRPDADSLLSQVDDVAADAVGSGWESRGRRQLAALLASRSPASDAAGSLRCVAGTQPRNPVRLAAVMGGALMLAVGLASPPLAVILPGSTLFGSGGTSPVLAFPDPARDTPVRVVTNGPMAARAPTPAAQAGTAGPVAGARPPAPANPTLNTHSAPSMLDLRDSDSATQDRSALGRSDPGQSTPASTKCTQELVFSVHKSCKEIHPEQPTPDSTGTAPDTAPIVPVLMPLPVPMHLPAPVQIPAPVQVPKSIPIRAKIQLRKDFPTPKASSLRWNDEVWDPQHGTTEKMDHEKMDQWPTKRSQSNSEWDNSRFGNDGPGSAESGSAGNR
jgi:eukaryotic-like serine/threonine-protein kinase